MDNPSTGYPNWIDPTSFADQIILNEIGREYDAYIRSAFFYKDRGGKLFAGPMWDYNLTFGAGLEYMFDNVSVEGWTYEMANTRQTPSNDWFLTLMDSPAFRDLVASRWRELRQGVLSDAAITQRIDMLVAPLLLALLPLTRALQAGTNHRKQLALEV